MAIPNRTVPSYAASSITDTKASTTLASFNYQSPTPRNADEELTSETDTGTPGPSTTTYTYDPDSRLTSAGSSTYTYNNASQLSTGPGGTAQYSDPAGELCWSAATMPQAELHQPALGRHHLQLQHGRRADGRNLKLFQRYLRMGRAR